VTSAHIIIEASLDRQPVLWHRNETDTSQFLENKKTVFRLKAIANKYSARISFN